MNLKVISRNVGFALLVSALFMFLSILVSVFNGNDSALAALSISFVITFTVGIFPFIFVRKASTISQSDGYMIIFLSWLLSFIFGMLPYLLWGGPFTVVNAWFESVSGFTTTGATILERVEVLPQSLLFWRSSTHFIGGLGVVVFLLLMVPHSSPVKLRLTNMELSTLSKESYMARANKTVYIFTYVYLVLNVLAFFCYWIAGMSAFDAVNHAFSVCATGGFSTRSASIGYYDSTAIDIITIVFMYLSSVHFGMLYMAVVYRSLRKLDNPILKLYTGSLIVVSFLVALSLKTSCTVGSWGRAALDGTFHTLSYVSSTGFAIADNNTWPFFACVLLMFFGVMGGMAGSTTGGMKSDRIYLLWKAMRQYVRQSRHPNVVKEMKIGDRVIDADDVFPHLIFMILFFVIMMLSVVLCLGFGADIQDAVAGTVSTLSTVGPAMGEIGSLGNFNHLNPAVKVIFTINMYLGRVEIFPVLIVLSMIFSHNRR